MRYKSVVNHSV